MTSKKSANVCILMGFMCKYFNLIKINKNLALKLLN